ncbi:MAG: tetratricopeptide repeat protein [Candidatus Omnitrophica bacterium]|nr:tetratricopeptide repeat protein [Candidatus Omnitrophota bacterium]
MDSLGLYHAALEDYRAGHTESAERKLEQIFSQNPAFEDAYEALSVIYFNQKCYDEAVGVLRKWISQNPNAVMAQVNLSRCLAAKGMILEAEQAQAEARKLTWKAELKAKKLEMPKVDYRERIERYKKVIDLDPKDVLGYFTLGNTYLEAGMKREAVDSLQKAIDVDPGHSSSYLSLGLALEALQDKGMAVEIYKRGIQIANAKGDLMPLKKMESRLNTLT